KAQNCSPNPFFVAIGLPGVYPNPIQSSNLASGTQNVPYSETITIIVLPDTTIDLSVFAPGLPTINVEVAYQRVSGFTGLPAGITYACEPSNCEVPGDTSGCVGLGGTPTQAGEFTVGMTTEVGIAIPTSVPVIGGTVQSLPIPGISWTLVIDSNTVSTAKPQENAFGVVRNIPNPFQGNTTITYQAPKPAQVQFEVLDLTGHRLHQANYRAQTGENTIVFDAAGYAPGIYLYTLSDGNKAVTNKMVISK
ncbi:MAG TPA: T9SS type A sorting domain-containing protein, partial [Bacteroidetes bacterium]|nr:T9SS type A sorting domain-containing protein [Bacteroidota bacterium]